MKRGFSGSADGASAAVFSSKTEFYYRIINRRVNLIAFLQNTHIDPVIQSLGNISYIHARTGRDILVIKLLVSVSQHIEQYLKLYAVREFKTLVDNF